MCVKCQSQRIRTEHTDGLIKTICLACGHVEIERYGWRHKGKTEVREAVETVQG